MAFSFQKAGQLVLGITAICWFLSHFCLFSQWLFYLMLLNFFAGASLYIYMRFKDIEGRLPALIGYMALLPLFIIQPFCNSPGPYLYHCEIDEPLECEAHGGYQNLSSLALNQRDDRFFRLGRISVTEDGQTCEIPVMDSSSGKFILQTNCNISDARIKVLWAYEGGQMRESDGIIYFGDYRKKWWQ